jgi:iron complex outermembrane receptor protein
VAFIDNVTDEEYLVQTFDLSTDAVFGMTEQYYGKPKWWGVSLKYNF